MCESEVSFTLSELRLREINMLSEGYQSAALGWNWRTAVSVEAFHPRFADQISTIFAAAVRLQVMDG